MNGDPAVEAASKAWRTASHGRHGDMPSSEKIAAMLTDAAREALKPIREQMVVAKARYSELQDLMLAAATSAETSRYANEMAGIQYLYRLIAPLVYSAEELS